MSKNLKLETVIENAAATARPGDDIGILFKNVIVVPTSPGFRILASHVVCPQVLWDSWLARWRQQMREAIDLYIRRPAVVLRQTYLSRLDGAVPIDGMVIGCNVILLCADIEDVEDAKAGADTPLPVQNRI